MSKRESGISSRNLEIAASSLSFFFVYFIRGGNRAFSHDVTAAILVFQNNETAATYVGVPRQACGGSFGTRLGTQVRDFSACCYSTSETGVYFETSRDHFDFFWLQ